jgi:hypothetical protein
MNMAKLLAVVTGGTVILVLSSIYSGYVFSWLWLWFAVPLGAPPIGVAMAIGLRLLIAQHPGLSKKKSDDDYGFIDTLAIGIFLTSMLWLMGYIAHLFV